MPSLGKRKCLDGPSEILDQKIKDLPAGPYKIGLKAVMAHIDAAIKHYKRGQSEPDQTLFTDVVFRCNVSAVQRPPTG
ncbi:hypothetical protein [Bradyrhizobium sp. 176]|uniref:hypothetical protein n=1 Tax=Bradyrhizobium sp. 176 TaxID=2782646 RepID=UPI001FFADEB1|nr:hypothetical protein [Bradyrhizobium sp. 176]